MWTVRVILLLALSLYLVECDARGGRRNSLIGPAAGPRDHQRPHEPPRRCDCRNGGSCIYSGNTRSCVCSTNFTGSFCQYPVDPCLVNPCKNNGTCSVESNATNSAPGNFTCACDSQTTGTDCSIWFNPCANPNACGTGYTCFSLINGTETSFGVAICSGPNGWYPSPSPSFFRRKFNKIKLGHDDSHEEDDD